MSNKIHPNVPDVSFDYENRTLASRTPLEQVADTIESITCGFTDTEAMRLASKIPEDAYSEFIRALGDAYETGAEMVKFKVTGSNQEKTVDAVMSIIDAGRSTKTFIDVARVVIGLMHEKGLIAKVEIDNGR